MWCPRCQGRLLAPSGPAAPVATTRPPAHPQSPQRNASRLPTGFRWIAVRPGPPPPPRRRRRPLGPTPRYRAVPRWGLIDSIAPTAPAEPRSAGRVSEAAVQATLLASAAIFALAAAAHVLRYVLLLVNRNTLLPPLIADAALLMGVLVSLAAIAAMIASMAVTTAWLVGRRAQAFRLRGHDDPRPGWTLWAGCMTPVVNLVWAPVFVNELAHTEKSQARLRGRITAWWIAWICSALVSGWATWTSAATGPQSVADNTVTEILAYLVGLTALLLLWRVVNGFTNRPVQQNSPTHRWVVVAEQAPSDTVAEQAPSDTVAEQAPSGTVAEQAPGGDRPATAGPTQSPVSASGSADVVESRDPEPAA